MQVVGRSFGRLVVGLATVASVGCGAEATGNTAAPATSACTTTTAPASGRSLDELTPAERDALTAPDRIDALVDVAAADATLATTLGDRYGGLWIEGSGAAGRLVVRVVDPTAADRSIVTDATGHAERVDVRPTEFGLALLQELSDQVQSLVDGPAFVGVDPHDGRVHVELYGRELGGRTCASSGPDVDALRRRIARLEWPSGDPNDAVVIELLSADERTFDSTPATI